LASLCPQLERAVKGVFCTIINFCPDGYLFQPSETAVLEELNNGTMDGVIAAAQQSPRVLHMRMFAQHYDVGRLRLAGVQLHLAAPN
jgi:hypothetical protein